MSESDVEELDWTAELKVTEHLWDEKEEISEPDQYSGSTSVSDVTTGLLQEGSKIPIYCEGVMIYK